MKNKKLILFVFLLFNLGIYSKKIIKNDKLKNDKIESYKLKSDKSMQLENLKKSYNLLKVSSLDDVDLILKNTKDYTLKLKNEIINSYKKYKENPYNLINFFYDTVGLLDEMDRVLDGAGHILYLYTLVKHKDQNIMNSINNAIVDLDKFSNDTIAYSIELYEVIDFLNNEINEKCIDLKFNQKKLLKETLDGFLKNGINLSEEKRKELIDISNKLTEVGLKFDSNIYKGSAFGIWVEKTDLVGLTDEQFSNFKKDKDDKYFITLNNNHFSTVMKDCKNRELRKRLYFMYRNLAYPDNEEPLKEIIKLKTLYAKKVGYSNAVEYQIENQMANKIETVNNLIESIYKATRDRSIEESSILEDYSKLVFKDEDDKNFYPWDVAYVSNKYTEDKFKYDSKEVEKYFTVEDTIKSLISIYSDFFDINFEIVDISKEEWIWNDKLTLLRVKEKNGDIIGDIILDIYIRPGKYSHACCMPIFRGVKNDNNLSQVPIASIICSFNESTKDYPAFMKFSDVNTFFHEFGHALHSLFGATEFYSQSGTKTSTDFVEIPSQLFEQWLMEPDILKRITSHYKTKESMPEELINKLIGMERYDIALFCQNQLAYGLLSLNIYLDNEKSFRDIKEKYLNNLITASKFKFETNWECSFGHLNGYGCKYYSYMWSLAYALDIYSYIKKNKAHLNPIFGKKLKELILSKGKSEDYDKMIFDFLGREIDFKAFYDYVSGK